jgi:hypothetical protein
MGVKEKALHLASFLHWVQQPLALLVWSALNELRLYSVFDMMFPLAHMSRVGGGVGGGVGGAVGGAVGGGFVRLYVEYVGEETKLSQVPSYREHVRSVDHEKAPHLLDSSLQINAQATAEWTSNLAPVLDPTGPLEQKAELQKPPGISSLKPSGIGSAVGSKVGGDGVGGGVGTAVGFKVVGAGVGS